MNSRIWNIIDDCYINNLAKNPVFVVFHSPVIRKSMSPKFIELCTETPCLSPSEGHKHGGRKITKYLSLSSAMETKLFIPELRDIEMNAPSSASTVYLAKIKR